MSLMEVKNLSVSFGTEQSRINVLDGISLTVEAGQTLGIVGESGCGKSITALSIMGLLPKPSGQIDAGQILFKGNDILSLNAKERQALRGNRIAMIFQEPMTALNPVHRIGKQLAEVFQLHFAEMSSSTITQECETLLEQVGISDPRQRLQEYPHQLSGGMRQRVMIAMALACKPDVLIADEPTTALDVTIQAQILQLLKSLQEQAGMALIFITHDLGVIAEICDRVSVMYAGRVIEDSDVYTLFDAPAHPYTRGLLAALPSQSLQRKSVLKTIPGMVPSITDFSPACRFEPRCEFAETQCRQIKPQLERISADQAAACLRWQELP